MNISEYTTRKRKAVFKFCAVLFLLFVSILFSNIAIASPFKVGFVFLGPINDQGWNYAHNQGRLYLESKLKGSVVTDYVENVPDSAECERVIEKMIAGGDKLIFTTSYGFLEHAEKLAAKHPEVSFIHCMRSTNSKLKNLGTCTVYHWQPEYLAGIVAGRMTKTNRIGFIAAHPVPQVLQTINAFTLGVRSVNPKAIVKVIWTNTWSDLALEAEAATGLIESGADVLTMQENSPWTIVKTAEKHGVYSIGFHTDLKDTAPKGWLTGECWNWGPMYIKIVSEIMDHIWIFQNDHFGMETEYVKLARFGIVVPKRVQDEVATVENKIEADHFHVFQGPIFDRDGKERISKGVQFTDRQIDSMNWFVQGVDGTLPTSH